MHVYRIVHKTHAKDLSGEGARLNGGRWIDSLESLAIIVPSAVVSEEFNILINPSHPGMKEVRILSSSDFSFDYRLFGE
ncbi:MAG: RES family NAD+ phosphorylase [Spirochaetota bacterium]|nr:RES family NAD+ phosphorylase [Spirochaetota bacterium]